MKLTFIGAAHEVTGSCTLLTACGKHILIDCGMEQGADIYENAELPVAAGEVDAILLTHAHIDHSGLIPLMAARGFRGPVYTTEATAKLCDIMLRDSAYIQESEAEWRNRKAKRAGLDPYVPLYTVIDAQNALRLFVSKGYGETFSPFPGVTVGFTDAGHLLGSASIRVTVTEDGETRTLLFSGDLGNVNYQYNTYEGYGPGGIAVIVEALTDNKNRTAANVRSAFTKGSGSIGTQGCVSFMFDKKGQIIIDKEACDIEEDDLMMMALDAGAEDFSEEEDSFEIVTAPDDFQSVYDALSAGAVEMASAEITMIPQNYVTLTDENDIKQFNRTLDLLDEDDDVQAVYHNWEEA